MHSAVKPLEHSSAFEAFLALVEESPQAVSKPIEQRAAANGTNNIFFIVILYFSLEYKYFLL